MKIGHVVDLSHTVLPGKEEYRLEIDTRLTDDWDQFSQYPLEEGDWYIISEVTLNTHVGTHIEFPYHHFKDGLDAATFPLEGLIGEAVVLDISAWGNNDRITLEDLKRVAANRIRAGDIVYFHTGLDRYYRTDRQHHRPWFTTDAIEWLAQEARIKVMGVDTSGIEVRNPDGSACGGQPNHKVLLGAGIPLVEYMSNLASLVNKRFLTCILPIKIAGAEAFPVRVIALEIEVQL
jgi:arylformamidase